MTRTNAAVPMTAAAIRPTWVEGPPGGEIVAAGDTVTGPCRRLTEEKGWSVNVGTYGVYVEPPGSIVGDGDGDGDDVEDAEDAVAKCATDSTALVVEQARIVDSRSV